MKDIIDSLKLRLNNPLLISFLIAWPFWNWQISVGLIWYNSQTLHKYMGCDNYIDLINHYSSWLDCVFFPLFSALIYIFIFPWFKYFISKYSTTVVTKEEEEVLNISKKSVVPTMKYVKAVQDAEDQIKSLSEIIKKENSIQEQNNQLITSNTNINIELERTRGEVSILRETYKQLELELQNTKEDSDIWNQRYVDAERKLSNSEIENRKLLSLNSGLSDKLKKSTDNILSSFDGTPFKVNSLDGTWTILFSNLSSKDFLSEIDIKDKEIIKFRNTDNLAISFNKRIVYFINPLELSVMLKFYTTLDMDKMNTLNSFERDFNENLNTFLKVDFLFGSTNSEFSEFSFEYPDGFQIYITKKED